MASESKPGDARELRSDSLVEQLAPEPSDVRPLTMLSGLLGRSSREGYWRLYASPSFDEFLECAEDDIVSTQKIPQEQSPLGGKSASCSHGNWTK